MTGRKSSSIKVQITVLTSIFFSFSGFGYVNSKTLKVQEVVIYSYLLHGSDVTPSSYHAEKVGFTSFFSTQFEMSYPCNKYEQTMRSYLLSVSGFEDKAIYIYNKEYFPANKGSFSASG